MANKTQRQRYQDAKRIADKLRYFDEINAVDWLGCDLILAAILRDPAVPFDKLAKRVGPRLGWLPEACTASQIGNFLDGLTSNVHKALGPNENRPLRKLDRGRVFLTDFGRLVHAVARKGLFLKVVAVDEIPPEDWQICQAVLSYVERSPTASFKEIAAMIPKELKDVHHNDSTEWRDDSVSRWLSDFEKALAAARGFKDAAREADAPTSSQVGQQKERKKPVRDGKELIRRDTHGTHGLTSLGKKIRKLASYYTQVMNTCTDLAGPPLESPLRIAASEGISNFLLPHVVRTFTESVPRIPRTDLFNANDFAQQMANDEIHLAIAWNGYNEDYLAPPKDSGGPCPALRAKNPWLEVVELAHSAAPVCAIVSSQHPLAMKIDRTQHTGGIPVIDPELLQRHQLYYPQFYQLERVAAELMEDDRNRIMVPALPEVVTYVRLRQGVGLFPGWPWELARLEREGIQAAQIRHMHEETAHLYTMKLLAFLPGEITGQAHHDARPFLDQTEKELKRLQGQQKWTLARLEPNVLQQHADANWRFYFITTGPRKSRPLPRWRMGTLKTRFQGTNGEFGKHDASLEIHETSEGSDHRATYWMNITDDKPNCLAFKGFRDGSDTEIWSYSCFFAKLIQKGNHDRGEINHQLLLGMVFYNQPNEAGRDRPDSPTAALIVLSNQPLSAPTLEEIQESNLALFLSHGDPLPE